MAGDGIAQLHLPEEKGELWNGKAQLHLPEEKGELWNGKVPADVV